MFGGAHGELKAKRQESMDFQKASGSDSEFEYFDDFVDEAEEFNGASRAVKLSIRALNFNMMLAEKQGEQDPGTLRRVSLLSRASTLINSNRVAQQADHGNRPGPHYQAKNYSR